MQVFILCGGRGERMGLGPTPKALITPNIELGEKTIIDYIIDMYSKELQCDINVLCNSHNYKIFKEHFIKNEYDINGPRVFVYDTKNETETAERIKMVKKLIRKDEPFMVTYGDGLSDVNIADTLRFHKQHGRDVTMLGINPQINFGVLNITEVNSVSKFIEKPILRDLWINGGFFIFNGDVFDKGYFDKENCSLEKDVLPEVVKENQLMCYLHKGAWQCCDTQKDIIKIAELIRFKEKNGL